MTVLGIVVAAVCALVALLGLYYTVRDLSADLVLLGATALLALVWLVLGIALGLRDLGGGHPAPERVTLYGYLLTALLMAVGGGWVGIFERSRWGSLVITV